MANLRRRSARLSKTNINPSSPRKTPVTHARLGSIVERDETPEAAQQSIDGVLATPTPSRTIQKQLSELEVLKTPQTEPKPERAEMDPKTVHRSTAKAPDSGLKLGFSDINDRKNETPSKSASRQSVPTASTFEFKFSSDSNLSRDAQRLMENVREDAARIKAQMMAEKATQERKDAEAETMFGAGRKIAQPKGKAGRFSDVHMAQFKKMDSIENHASAYRAKSGFAAPTTQSLKRSPSKAGLDELDRPRTAGKDGQSRARLIPPPVTGRPQSVSPFKSTPFTEPRSTVGPVKRTRQSQHQDVSDSRPSRIAPKPASSTLHSPTKSSLARTSQSMQSHRTASTTSRSGSVRSIRSAKHPDAATAPLHSPAESPMTGLRAPKPTDFTEPIYPTLPQSPQKLQSSPSKETTFTSKIPTLTGLKSILRGNHKTNTTPLRQGTPKRPNTTGQNGSSTKKVDFTPSVKSRHAVKLAVDSPSPAKIRRDTPYKTYGPAVTYDSSAYTIKDDGFGEWDDGGDDDGSGNEVVYPTLPSAESSDNRMPSFKTKAKEAHRRESKEFKSIFTNLHPARNNEAVTLTSINTKVNQTNPEKHTNKILRSPSNTKTQPSPSTIRYVRTSDDGGLVQPFEDATGTVPHGLPGKKRRHESIQANDKHGMDEDAKENRRLSELPAVPGGWNDHSDEIENEANHRSGKRIRMSVAENKPVADKSTGRKVSTARETAAKNARERKGRGVLSLSRLNMLSRPKSQT